MEVYIRCNEPLIEDAVNLATSRSIPAREMQLRIVSMPLVEECEAPMFVADIREAEGEILVCRLRG